MEMDFVRSAGNGLEWIKPIREISSIEDWRRWLVSNLTSFDLKELDKAAVLVAAYKEGINYIFSEVKKRGLNGMELPRVGIVISGRLPGTAASDSESKTVFLSSSSLWFASLTNIEETFVNQTPRRETIFVGSRIDLYRLIGVEEGYHNIFGQVKGESDDEEVLPFTVPLEDYDAQEGEYRALKWQFKYAKVKNMPQETIDVLQQRLDLAKTVQGKAAI